MQTVIGDGVRDVRGYRGYNERMASTEWCIWMDKGLDVVSISFACSFTWWYRKSLKGRGIRRIEPRGQFSKAFGRQGLNLTGVFAED